MAPGSGPAATGHVVAASGPIAMGPFEDESGRPQPAPARKLWVASQLAGSDEVTLNVTGPDGRTTTMKRGPSGAAVSNAAQFWPGEIPVPASGTYRIEAVLGANRICVTTQYRR